MHCYTTIRIIYASSLLRHPYYTCISLGVLVGDKKPVPPGAVAVGLVYPLLCRSSLIFGELGCRFTFERYTARTACAAGSLPLRVGWAGRLCADEAVLGVEGDGPGGTSCGVSPWDNSDVGKDSGKRVLNRSSLSGSERLTGTLPL